MPGATAGARNPGDRNARRDAAEEGQAQELSGRMVASHRLRPKRDEDGRRA